LSEAYTTPRTGRHKDPFRRNRREHSSHLQQALDRAREEEEARLQAAETAAQVVREGTYLVAELEPGYEQALKSLESNGIELMAVRATSSGVLHATIYVPRGKLSVLERKVIAYATEVTKKTKRPKNESLVTAIRNFRRAAVKSFWTDDINVYPAHDEVLWWEVWLRGDGQDVAETFRERATAVGMRIGQTHLTFPDRTVIIANATIAQLAESIEILDSIAELRRAKDSPELYVELRGREAREAIEDLLSRANRPRDGAPAIVILDTGVTAAHPLIAPFVDQQTFRAARTEWGGHDWHGHGTEMAGLALFGDLVDGMGTATLLDIANTLESVKILPNDGQTDRELHGAITQDAINTAEIDDTDRQRIYSMAVTAPDYRDRGRPTSWSAELDQLAAGVEDERPRLIVVSAGNSAFDARRTHPEHLETEAIHDPAQAWNVLTVGASTNKWTVDDPTFEGWTVLASPGDLSPATTTSRPWDEKIWPLKPDVVLEGGNFAVDPGGTQVDSPDSLGLLTTYYQPLVRPFTISRDTSAACALAARMAGHVQSQYPSLWPETVRALLVHSAEWSELMRRRYLRGNQKRYYERLVQYCGFGVPSLDRALWSARNDLTLIVQETMQPFVDSENRVKTRDMHLHKLPWPADALRALGEVQVELRVTLSYFVEPNPARRGWKYRHRYASYGLRFDVQAPTEEVDDFRARVNKLARAEEEEETYASDTTDWQLGWQRRHRGSLHSDTWTGTAIDLAERQHISVVPVGGWWKERPKRGRGNTPVRYGLVVSIRVPEVDVDIYTPVATQIGIIVEV
jgi:hypothetical protein